MEVTLSDLKGQLTAKTDEVEEMNTKLLKKDELLITIKNEIESKDE